MFEIIVTNHMTSRVLETCDKKPSMKRVKQVKDETLKKYPNEPGQNLWTFCVIQKDNRKIVAILPNKYGV